jgi:hypothetical protein
MALVKCRECGREISDQATACPHCGVPMRAAVPRDTEAEKKKSQGCLGGCLTVVVVLAILGSLSGKGGSSSASPERDQNSAVAAWTMCEEFVKRQLRAPATADFPWGYDQFTRRESDSVWVVTSYVDAQNAFGAKIRNNFVCRVRWTGGDNWRDEGTVVLSR